MFYSPFFEVLKKLEKHFYDFVVYLVIYLIAYMADLYVIGRFDRNLPTLSLLVFIASYLSARFIIKKFKKQKLFGTFVNWNINYCIFLAFFSWICYLLFFRSRMGL